MGVEAVEEVEVEVEADLGYWFGLISKEGTQQGG